MNLKETKCIMKSGEKVNIQGRKMKKKIGAILRIIGGLLLVFIAIRLIVPTWTPEIESENGISELRKVELEETSMEVMIRGNDKENPVLLFVHGGPCCSEIPYVRKYQENLEKDFTIVHYDQRGSGKSYEFFKDYSEVTAVTHTEDLIALTEYIKEYLDKDKVILAGHSFGTYIGTMAVAKRPDLFQAYIGIGQMSNSIESELNNLKKCIVAAESAGNHRDVRKLKKLELKIAKGKKITPRSYVRKYGFAARKINEDMDYLEAFLFGTEYNLLDAIRFYTGYILHQDTLIREASDKPITELVTKIDIPVYFVMGKCDGMTSPKAAEEYLNNLSGEGAKELVIFEESAHYPQFEEEEKFYQWMKDTFREE